MAIKLQLCDAAGQNLSSVAVPLTLQDIVGPPNKPKPTLPSAFRYDASFNGYEADKAPSLDQGTFAVYFRAAGDATVHLAIFRIGPV